MKVKYSKLSRNQLSDIKNFLVQKGVVKASSYLSRIKNRMEYLVKYPYIGRVNRVYNDEKVREIVIEGYKVIYEVQDKVILVLAIYRAIDFDETQLFDE